MMRTAALCIALLSCGCIAAGARTAVDWPAFLGRHDMNLKKGETVRIVPVR